MPVLSTDGRRYVALTLFGEARGQSVAGQIAVASVIRNRLQSKRWGLSYADVVLAPWQFSCWNHKDPNRSVLDALLADDPAIVLAPVDRRAWRQCQWIADGLVSDAFESTVGRAMHYYATWLDPAPAWAKTGVLVATVDGHHFFEGVR